MKMNKIIIPAAMLAVGVALVGSISSTLAWYQYSTKAQAAFIGTSIGQSENLEIKTGSGQNIRWKSNLTTDDVNALAGLNVTHPNLLPVTPGITVAKDGAIPAKTAFKAGIETGVAGYRGEAAPENVIQFDLQIRYKKTADQAEYLDKDLKLVDLTIMNNAETNVAASNDLYKALRVHFAVVDGDNYLFANDNDKSSTAELSTTTYGKLDTDNDGQWDKTLKYEWESPTDVIYGADGTSETSYNVAALDLANNPLNLGQLAANENGTTVRVTIWIEGWQKLKGISQDNIEYGSDSRTAALWDPEVYVGKKFNVGMRFQADDHQ